MRSTYPAASTVEGLVLVSGAPTSCYRLGVHVEGFGHSSTCPVYLSLSRRSLGRSSRRCRSRGRQTGDHR